VGLGLRAARPAARPAPAAPGAAPGAAGSAVTGVLQRVARTDREVVVIGPGDRGPETETTVAVPEGTPVTRGGKEVGLEGLKEGDPVTVRAERRAGRLTATALQVGPPAPEATVAQKPAMPAEREPVVPRVRRALKIADDVL